MTNAAHRLHALLVEWTVPKGASALSTRGYGPPALDFWHRQREAVDLLRQVERILDQLEAAGDSTDTFRSVVDRWYGAVFSLDIWWHAAANNDTPTLDLHALDLLKILGDIAKTVRLTPETLTGRTDLQDTLTQAAELARRDDALPDQLRRYVLALISEVRGVLDDPDAHSSEYTRSIVMELGGALTTVAGQSEAHRTRWFGFAKQFLFIYAAPVSVQITAAEVIREIMS